MCSLNLPHCVCEHRDVGEVRLYISTADFTITNPFLLVAYFQSASEIKCAALHMVLIIGVLYGCGAEDGLSINQ